MWVWLAAAAEPPPLEVSLGAVARSGWFVSRTGAGGSDVTPVHFGVRLATAGHLHPWIVLRLDATRMTHDLWFERASSPQQWSTIQLAFGPMIGPHGVRLRAGAGGEGLPTADRFVSRPAVTGGLEIDLGARWCRARFDVDYGTIWGVGPIGRFGAELVIPPSTPLGIVVDVGARWSRGVFSDQGTVTQVQVNRSLSAGLSTRVRFGPTRQFLQASPITR